MSSTYQVRTKAFVYESTSPDLYHFLDNSLNSNIDPEPEYFSNFKDPEIAKNVFYFIRNSQPPQKVWTHPYDDEEVSEIIKAWTKHSESNAADRMLIESVQGDQGKVSSIISPNKKTDKLKSYITNYTKTNFVDGVFTFNHEYSSNNNCDLDTVVTFLNENRDNEEKLISVIEYDDDEQPNVSLFVDGIEINLFSPSCTERTIMYDWEGFYCGENEDRLVDNSWNYNRHHLPPVTLPYKIDWLNEAHVRLVSAYSDFYHRAPNPNMIGEYESEKIKREIQLANQKEAEAREKDVQDEKKRLKSLSDEQLLAEHSNPFINRGLSSKSFLLYNEITERGLSVTVIDPKADGNAFKRLNDAVSKH